MPLQIRQDEEGGDYTHLYGTVHDSKGKPLKGAIVDIWHDVRTLASS